MATQKIYAGASLRETRGRAAFVPDIKPGRWIGEVSGQRRVVFIADEGRIGRILGKAPDKGKIIRGSRPQHQATAVAKAER